MGVPACARCGKCGSDLAQGPSEHVAPSPHRFVARYKQTTGEAYEVCLGCVQTRAALRARNEDDGQANDAANGAGR